MTPDRLASLAKHVREVGTLKRADQLELVEELERTRESGAKLVKALRHAVDGWEDAAGQISDYLREKYGYDEDLQRLRDGLPKYEAQFGVTP